MKSLLDLPVKFKFLLMLGVIVALFAIAMYVGYNATTALLNAQMESRTKQLNVTDLARVLANHNEARLAALMLLSSNDHKEQLEWADRAKGAHEENEVLLKQLEERNADSTAFLQKLHEHNQQRDAFSAARGRAIELALAGNLAEAKRLILGENAPRYAKARDIINILIASAGEYATAALEHSREVTKRARSVFVIVAGGVIAISIVALLLLSRMIASPLQNLVFAAREVASGNLKVTVPMTERRDEVGTLANAFATMLENFRTVHREIQQGVNVLASSASEIFTATAQIAASATETATAVSQTTSTAEEVKQTAQVAAQKAGNVADIAQRAAQSAQVGRKAIDESVAGMNHVREQMELIAETVVRLSEQTQAIGEIIASVNDLAEQSNLLAVNASIEAAKAGEHGKGFAVVAHEIRNLANQSKESTAQVRNLLNEIQRATTATVMAAEQGSKAVEGGVKQVNQSGEAIRTLAESIVAAAQAATQITASAQEQLIGIDQVTVAIQNILQASRQNATGTQQAETGAKNLSQLGQTLKAAVQKFSV